MKIQINVDISKYIIVIIFSNRLKTLRKKLKLLKMLLRKSWKKQKVQKKKKTRSMGTYRTQTELSLRRKHKNRKTN